MKLNGLSKKFKKLNFYWWFKTITLQQVSGALLLRVTTSYARATVTECCCTKMFMKYRKHGSPETDKTSTNLLHLPSLPFFSKLWSPSARRNSNSGKAIFPLKLSILVSGIEIARQGQGKYGFPRTLYLPSTNQLSSLTSSKTH